MEQVAGVVTPIAGNRLEGLRFKIQKFINLISNPVK
jgi:hypothetical protein